VPKPFKGKIDLDIRASTPDWDAFLPDKAPEGAPNVLVVLYDDTGLAAWSPFGGRIEMPTLQKLADNGLTYSQWHTTALCSPTRSVFLTGRNHHQNGFASISETAPTSGTHVVGVEFTKECTGEYHEPHGTLKLYVDDEVVAEHEIRGVASRYSLCGEGLCIGYDGGDAVSSEYKPTFEFTGGRIVKVVFDVADDAYVDVEKHLEAAIARD
jgi:hypothetical protein